MTHTPKAALRPHYEGLRNHLSPTARAEAEGEILARLFALPAWREAPLICGYASVRGELDTRPIWERAAAEGKDYALPVTVTGAAEGRMVFRATGAYTPHELVPARYGLPEPPAHWRALSLADFDRGLILVPGLAFDDGGFRVGYGGGYYDRFLAALRGANIPVTTVGPAFSVCRPAALPREDHDIPVDIIIDERRTVLTHGHPSR